MLRGRLGLRLWRRGRVRGKIVFRMASSSVPTPAVPRTPPPLPPSSPPQTHQRSVGERTKKEVAAKAGWRCQSCGETLGADYEIDHITALANGGHNGFDNLQSLCPACHLSKTQHDHWQARMRRQEALALLDDVEGAGSDIDVDFDFDHAHAWTRVARRLDEDQRAAATAAAGDGASVRVVAGPGTGKTAVLTARICFLVDCMGGSSRRVSADCVFFLLVVVVSITLHRYPTHSAFSFPSPLSFCRHPTRGDRGPHVH